MAVISSEENIKNMPRRSRRSPASSPIRAALTDAEVDRLVEEGKVDRARHLQHPRDRDRLHPDGDGVGVRAGHRATTPRRSGAWTTSCSCSSRRSIPTGRSWTPTSTARTSAPSTRAAACPGSTTTTSATTTTATGTCSPRRRRRALNRAVYREWFPQVWLDEHQMGTDRPADLHRRRSPIPSTPTIHPLIWREVNLIGANMALRLEQAGQERRHLRLLVRRLLARRHAQHRLVEEHLRPADGDRVGAHRHADRHRAGRARAAGRKGLVEYGPQTNFPNPWPGGSWRLRDIMDYERIASDALLETCRDHRHDLLRDVAARARAAIAAVEPREALPHPRIDQRDRPHRSASGRGSWTSTASRCSQAANGDVWIPLAQPYGAFVTRDADAAALPGGQAAARAATSSAPTTSPPGRCR